MKLTIIEQTKEKSFSKALHSLSSHEVLIYKVHNDTGMIICSRSGNLLDFFDGAPESYDTPESFLRTFEGDYDNFEVVSMVNTNDIELSVQINRD